ncbi:uncharacterized protein LOC118424882 [Branchiostoma floridae]|uniref:Uncharacterized protein LOC118424882 n=1 Tax=Branchiostoma floridae TaxID=7739 RepID=A0A9J7N1S3_BRAFL|nr:uncharacterized protein LOC118424882 [Branchiostoma floridae]
MHEYFYFYAVLGKAAFRGIPPSNPVAGSSTPPPSRLVPVSRWCRHPRPAVLLSGQCRGKRNLHTVLVYSGWTFLGLLCLGCWRDGGSRAIPTLEGIDQTYLDGSYGLRQDAKLKCCMAALSRGFSVFALQNGGWCAASADGHNTYNMYGPVPGVHVPCETLHTAGCNLTTTTDGGVPEYEPPGDQPCHVTAGIHEGIHGIENPLQVHQCGNIIINAAASFQCNHPYQVSVQWTVRGNISQSLGEEGLSLEVLPDQDGIATDQLKLDLPPKTLPLGLFMVQVTVTMKIPEIGHTSIAVAQMWLQVLPFPITARMNALSARTTSLQSFWVVPTLVSPDPDCQVPSDQLSYAWTCEAVSYPNPPVTSGGISACEALLGDLQPGSDPDGGVLRFDSSTKPVPLNSIVKVSVVITATGHEPGSTFINIHTAGAPGLGEYWLRCTENCNPGDFISHKMLRLIISPTVDNSGPNLWTLEEAPTDFPGLDWTNDVLVANEDTLEVHPNVFTVPGNYTIRVANYVNPSFPRIAEYRFLVLRNPVPGSLLQSGSAEIPADVCSVLPADGVSLVEKFCVVCKGTMIA